METVSRSSAEVSSAEEQADSLLDHPMSGLVVVAGFVGGFLVFGLSLLTTVSP